MRIFLETYGCTFNRADSDALAKALRKAGHKLTGNESSAQLVVINSCGVKDATEQRILLRLRQLRCKPVLVTGCLAQADPERLLKSNPSISILGTFSQDQLARAVKATAQGKQVKIIGKSGFAEQEVTVQGVVARVQIARGCEGKCSFCQTKLARGALESIPPKQIVRLCEQAVAKGAKEIQLTAQDTGCYGFDLKSKVFLPQLLNEITAINGDFRARVGMMNPEHALKILPQLLRAFENEKIYDFLHLPLQSGSDRVLRAMKRRHSTRDFEKVASAFRKKFPAAMVFTDVIVGFPTETEADFRKTLALLKQVKPDFTNVSRYSARPKTAAAQMKQLPTETINRRTSECSALCKSIARDMNVARIGSRGTALVTEKQRGAWLARGENYAPVLLKRGKLGEFIELRVVGVKGSVLEGERV